MTALAARIPTPRTMIAPMATSRLLWLEIRRNATVWALPLVAVLLFFDSYRTAGGYPPVWDVRASIIGNHMLFDFGTFAGGLSAWAGSREGRRHTRDLVATTARPVWTRQAAALAGTLFWVLLGFLAAVAVLYIQTARQATWSSPPLWPVAVGVVALVTICAIGFTAGALFPGRFTAPVVAVGVVVLYMAGLREALDQSSTYALLSPATSVPPNDTGMFYRVAPDVAIAQVMFMGGIAVAVLGVLALAPALHWPGRWGRPAGGGTGRWLRAAAIAAVAAGVAVAGTAAGLTGTAHYGVSGWDIPALHDAASDQPVAYTPDCAGTGLQLCLHPAFGADLGELSTALDQVAAEVAGLPGAPARAQEVATDAQFNPTGNGVIVGTPPVFEFTLGNSPGSFPQGADAFRASFQQAFLDALMTGRSVESPGFGGNPVLPTAAQQAAVTALMTAVGSPAPIYGHETDGPGAQAGPSPAQITAAAKRFAALSPTVRHAWLAAHLPALRAGYITLAQLP
jgi:hypothetical protein